MDITNLLKPNSIAIIGATTKPGMTGGTTMSVVKSRIADRVYYISPTRDEINGRKCYKSLQDLPEVVDQMIFCTPSKAIPPYLEEGGKLGVKSAVILASGFEEEHTEQAQQLAKTVRDLCNQYNIALCGPNCVGYVNAVDGICGGAANAELLDNDTKHGIAIVAQSGYITSGFMEPDNKYVAYSVSAGNCSICSLEDYMLYFAQDDRVTCIAAYVEGLKKPDVLVKALKLAAEKRKPVVVLKSGMSQKGSAAAASHTGSLAGDYKTYESVFKKFGVVLTHSLQEFCSTARMFAVLNGNIPKGAGIGAINFSGGENTLCADTCERMGLYLPDYAPETAAAVKAVIPSYASAENPLDGTTALFTEDDKVRALFNAVGADPSIDLITLGNDVGENSEVKDITCSRIMAELAAQGKLIPSVVIPSFEKARNVEVRERFEKSGIPVLSTGDLAYTAIRHLCDFASYDYTKATLELAIPEFKGTGTVALSEGDSKKCIAECGIRIPGQAIAKEEADIDACLENIPFPIAMKVESPDILHKTDAGGVKLKLESKEAVHQAFREIMANCRAYKPDAVINGVLIQEMMPAGKEFIIGVKNDKQFGPMLLVGLGGVFVEVFKDAALYPCPLNKDEALAMIRSLKGYKMLTGYRGSKPSDVDALADLMVRVSEYAVENKDTIAEMDLNPVFVYDEGDGVCAVDALIIKKN